MKRSKQKSVALAMVGFDTSSDMNNLSILCPDCGGPEHGSPLYEGDEWGGDVPDCESCGAAIHGLVDPSC